MKWFLLIVIKAYWQFIPPANRRTCLFKNSCSHFVFETTQKHGFTAGINALYYRFKTCRKGFILYTHPHTGMKEMILPNKDIITQEEISDRLLFNCHAAKI